MGHGNGVFERMMQGRLNVKTLVLRFPFFTRKQNRYFGLRKLIFFHYQNSCGKSNQIIGLIFAFTW